MLSKAAGVRRRESDDYGNGNVNHSGACTKKCRPRLFKSGYDKAGGWLFPFAGGFGLSDCSQFVRMRATMHFLLDVAV
jgi:hypothetical protein